MGWIKQDVKGDGSCFYRALYISATKHKSGNLVKKIIECLGKKYLFGDEEHFVNIMRNSLGRSLY